MLVTFHSLVYRYRVQFSGKQLVRHASVVAQSTSEAKAIELFRRERCVSSTPDGSASPSHVCTERWLLDSKKAIQKVRPRMRKDCIGASF
jgi:hypothetical protein